MLLPITLLSLPIPVCSACPATHCPAAYLPVPWKTSAVSAAVTPALVSGNFFSHSLVCKVPRRSSAVQCFTAELFGRARRSHKRAAFLFHGRSLKMKEGKKERKVTWGWFFLLLFLCVCVCVLTLYKLKNLKVFTPATFWASLCPLTCLRAAEGVPLPITHRPAILGREGYISAFLVSLQRQ